MSFRDFISRVFKKNRTTGASSGARAAFDSRVFPDFPKNPMNSTPLGSTIEGANLANIATVGDAISAALRSAKGRLPAGWPQYADGELNALQRVYAQMKAKAATRPTVDASLVKSLAEQYVDRLRRSEKAQSEYMDAQLTNLNMSIDFANTLGYGGALQTALDWSQKSGWLSS